ncbi:MAG: TusE/DsrC/DsvC family sulfur relay protein [Planctomycetota bacterium]
MVEARGEKGAWAVDALGFLLDPAQWTESFALDMAAEAGIRGGLTLEHWKVVRFIRRRYETTRRCPAIFETCRANGLRLRDLERLFPAGYQRGACKLAGVSYRGIQLPVAWAEAANGEQARVDTPKTYRVDVQGFLVDPSEWDESFATHKAAEMKIPGGLGARHWQLVRFLRASYAKDGVVPTVYKACDHLGVDLDELERLFPDGYHRGAVKIAGLRLPVGS